MHGVHVRACYVYACLMFEMRVCRYACACAGGAGTGTAGIVLELEWFWYWCWLRSVVLDKLTIAEKEEP